MRRMEKEARNRAMLNAQEKDQPHNRALSAVFVPPGFPGAQTFTHAERRPDADEYGLKLLPDEIKAWKECDREGLRLMRDGLESDDESEPDDKKPQEVSESETE